ncbi:MAG: DUF4113 domain-containing protein [Kiritimatiellae bacterium]|nr:DUF4113 domain-containing protein [Kiritimatiellia bacterium]
MTQRAKASRFAQPDHPASKLSAAVDAINARMGRGTVFFAATGVERKWKMKREMLSKHYTTSWDGLLVVK